MKKGSEDLWEKGKDRDRPKLPSRGGNVNPRTFGSSLKKEKSRCRVEQRKKRNEMGAGQVFDGEGEKRP